MENVFRDIRRQDRLLDEARAIELLETAEYGFLSLGEGENGYAYGVPISYAYDRDEHALYFHCAPQGQKLDHMRRNNKVSFCVVGNTEPLPGKFTTRYESVAVFGTADIDPTDQERRKAVMKLVAKYCPEHIEMGQTYMEKSFHRTHTFRVVIDRMTGKSKK